MCELINVHGKVTSPDVAGVVPRVAAQAAAAHRFAEMVARAAYPLIDRAAIESAAPTERALADALMRSIAPADLAAMARELKAFDSELRGAIGFEGSLALIPLGEVLQLIRLQRQT